MKRRSLLKAAATAPMLTANAAPAPKLDYLKELGIKPIINAAGSYTMFTGSLMRPEVVTAIESMSHHFVRINELHDAVGKRIAAMVGAPAAMVSSGAAGALTCGMAGVLTGEDQSKILRIPDLTGMKSEVIVQKSHRFPYDHMIRNCGVKLIEVETRAQLEAAINERTAMLLFLNKSEPLGHVKMDEFVQIGKRAGIPTMNDAAADVPPVENLLRPIRLGFDLVAVSGGKCIRGPQSAGILFGREDLIRAARLNTLPFSDSIARSCKVNKEEMVGMMVALDLFLKEDHGAQYKEADRRIALIRTAITKVAGVKAEPFQPRIANQTPHLRVSWDSRVAVTPDQVREKLRGGDPSIELVPGSEVAGTLEICAWTLQPGEAETLARRMAAILGGTA